VGGSQVVVNTNNYMQHQTEQDIAVSGTKVVTVWAETSGQITNGIYARVYNTDTSTWETDYAINTATSGRFARIDTLNDGKFIVTWHGIGPDGSGYAVQGQILNADGTLSGSEFTVSTTANGNQEYSDVVALTGGGFVVVWEGPGDNSAATSDFGIWGQVFDASGNKVGGEFLVNDTVVGQQRYPDVAALSDGDFVVTWQDENGTDGDAGGIYMKRFNPDGTVDTTVAATPAAPSLDPSGTAAFNITTFADTARMRGADVGDLDGDGDLDLIYHQFTDADYNGHINFSLNNGDGTFTMGTPTLAMTSSINRLALGDLDNDGDLDFITTEGKVYQNDGSANFTVNAGFSGIANSEMAVADVNNDGKDDLVLVTNGTTKIYLNETVTAGTMVLTDNGQTIGSTNGTSIAFGDLDGDGDLDMVVGASNVGAEIWSNDGSGNFTLENTLTASTSTINAIEIADFDGDGKADIWLTNRGTDNMFFTNQSTGVGDYSFSTATNYAATVSTDNTRQGSSYGDFDGDGDLDIIVGRSGPNEFWRNDGGTFTNINENSEISTQGGWGFEVAMADFNGDGFDDVFIANEQGAGFTSEIMTNTTNNIDYCYVADTAINPFGSLSVTDSDSANMKMAVVKIDGYLAGDVLAVGTPGSLTVTFDTDKGMLFLSGDATIATYQTALQSISFTSSVEAAGSRLLKLDVIDDGGASSSVTSTVNFVNTDPIVLDLDGDGVELVSAENGVQFDADADGDKEQIGWAGMDDGILVYDVNQDGAINDMSEVVSHYFSYQDRNAELLLDSSMEVLSLYDDNKDGVIDEHDEIYDGLSVWQDANGDGITDEGEMRSLKDEGVAAIDLGYEDEDAIIDGNQVSKSGTAVYEDGTEAEWNEVAFELDNSDQLFTEVVSPLLDENTVPMMVEVAEVETTNADVAEMDEIALLKEIVGTDDLEGLAQETVTDTQVNVTQAQAQNQTSTDSSADVVVAIDEQESYTSTQTQDDSFVPAAQ